ncbi:MAG TPA: ATP-binding protein [Chiayiivirga sp.]|nr:ATP-binding protein [Chiayiivirga sp.]
MLCLVLMAFASWATAGPLGQAWVSRHYGSADGLPVGSVNAAVMDAEGFLWLATHDGLARFDGAQFEVYDSIRFPAMNGNRVLSVHRDAQGRVFALTEPGDWLRVESNRIRSAFVENASGLGARHVDLMSLCVTAARGLWCPDQDGQYHIRLNFPAGIDPALALLGPNDSAWLLSRQRDVWLYRRGHWRAVWQAGDRVVRAVTATGVVASDGSFWTVVGERLLRVGPDASQRWFGDRLDPLRVIDIRLDRDGEIFIGASNGVFRVQNDRPVRVFHTEDAKEDAGDEPVYLSWQAPDGAHWISHGGRLWRIDASVDRWKNPNPKPVFDSPGLIQNLSFGSDGLVWVMSLHDGLHRLNRARVDVLDQARGLHGNNVYGISRAPDGTMWLGSLGAGLMALAADGTVRSYGVEDGLPGNNPWVVSVAPDGTVYTATYAPGLWRKPADQQGFEAVPLPVELAQEQIRALLFAPDQSLWLGTSAGAWRRQDGRWEKIWPEPGRRVRVGAIAMQGARIWLGSDEGVWALTGMQASAVAGDVLAHTAIRGLDISSDGALWISTDGRGLVRVAANDPEGHHALQLTRREGLPSNTPHVVREDARGNLWVNSNQGIFRINRSGLDAILAGTKSRLAPLSLGLSDGLIELEGNGGVQPVMAESADGTFWFASQGGVVRFNPMALPLHERPPRARIDGLEFDGEALPLAPDGRLPVGVRSLRFLFRAADLVGNGEARYRHRLLPDSQRWSDAGSEHSTQFSALAPGRYRFQVLAGNSDGIWASEPAEVAFEVLPYWHETFAARVAFAAILALLLALGWWWRVRRLHHRARVLDLKIRSGTRKLRREKSRVERAMLELAHAHQGLEDRNLALADQARRLEDLDRFRRRVLANVSHELRTPVMLVGLPLEELEQRAIGLDVEGKARLRLARQQLERLQGLVEQLMSLIQAESGQMPLRLTRVDMSAFGRQLIASYRPKAMTAEVELSLQVHEGLEPVYADLVHLATIFGNLLDNALKYAPKGSVVVVSLAARDEGVEMGVCDAGSGFDASTARRLFERFYRADGMPRDGREGLGIGLSLVQELVQLHGGEVSAQSQPGVETWFRVWLPAGSEHVALEDLLVPPAESALPAVARSTQDLDAEGCILLVEDHPDLASYLAERLGERICTVHANCAETALHILETDPRIRLVISDVMLPGMDGIALCQKLRSDAGTSHRPVILISARATHHDVDAGLAAGAVAYLAKPFGFDRLLQAIVEAWPALRQRLQPLPTAPESLDSVMNLGLEHLPDAAFSVVEWAELAHLSERQLRRRVKESCGQSPQNWLREQRLLRVHQLLRDGHCKTLLEAGERCGLDNPSYLYRSYRARFGER